MAQALVDTVPAPRITTRAGGAPGRLPLTKYYRERYGHTDAEFPVARWISDSAISLPVGPHLDEEDMRFIADCMGRAIAECRP